MSDRRTMTTVLALLVVLLSASAAHADTRIALVVGNNVGQPGEEPLRYAEQDASRVRDVLVELGGVERRRAYLLKGRNVDQLRATLAEIRGRAQELSQDGQQVTVLFYFAGHGTEEAIHLGRSTVRRAELLRWLEALPCELRIIVIDTCRSQGRSRGVRRGEAFDVYVDDQSTARGTVMITSTGEGEPAQESDQLRGALFTHFLVSGLRGAADHDGDGRITVAEVYTHTYRRTVIRSATGAPAVQHPEFSFDIAGAGDVVLTEPTRSSAALMLPPGRDARYLIYQLPTGTVLAEMTAEPARPVRLAVPPGRLLVQRRINTSYGVVEVELQPGRAHQVAAESFQVVPYEEIALRGGQFDLHPTAIGLGGSTRFAALPGGVVGFYGPELSLAHRFGRLLLAGDLAVDFGAFDSVYHRVFQIDMRADLLLGTWFQIGPLTFHLRAGPRVLVARQAIEHHQASALETIGLNPSSLRWSAAYGGSLQLGLGIPLARGLGLFLSIHGSIMAGLLSDGEDEATWQAVPGAGASLAFQWSP